MATLWLRETLKTISGYNKLNIGKGFALFMKYCVGWTVTEQIETSGSFVSTEQNGSTGSVTSPVRATGTITCDGNPNEPADNDTFTLDDGYHSPLTFTFKTTPVAATDIDRSGSPSAATMSARITAAINGQGDLDNLWINAVDAGGSVNLTNWRYNDLGNTTTTDDFTPLGAWAFSNMTGGVNGWKLTVTGSPFSSADEHKWVLIADSTNPRNNGIYEVDKVFDANNIQLDFRGNQEAGDGFTTASGLTWHIWASDYQVPTGVNGPGGVPYEEWWRAASPHSTGWAFEFSWSGDTLSPRYGVRVAVDGNWSGSKILGTGGRVAWGGADVWMLDVSVGCELNLSVFVDTDGDWLYFVGTRWLQNSAVSVQSCFGVSTLDPIEPEAVAGDELVGLFCTDSGIGNQGQDYGSLRTNTGQFSTGKFWDERSQAVISNCFIAEISWRNSNEGWSGRDPMTSPIGWLAPSGLEPNARLVSDLTWQIGKTQRYEGLLVLKDRNNVEPIGQYEWLGWMKGMQTIRNAADYNDSSPPGLEVRRMLPMSTDGVTKDWIVIWDGMILPWPNVTPQNQNH
jgi:hypothetical protein